MHLHLDTTRGFDGLLLAGVLAHLGVDFRPLVDALQRLQLPCRLQGPAQGAGGPGCLLIPSTDDLPSDGVWPESGLKEALGDLPLSDRAREQAFAALRLIVDAEAQAHAARPEALVFAAREGLALLQSLAAACWGLETARKALGIDRVTFSPLPWYSGAIRGPKGYRPLPSPATALLLRGLPVRAPGDEPADCRVDLLPVDGAALARVLPDAFEQPEGRVRDVGVGYRKGADEVWLRGLLLDEEEEAAPNDAQRRGGAESVAQLETHLDHLTGEELGAALEALAAMPEVLDVLWLPGIGKKSRPSGLLRLLCAPRHRKLVAEAVLRHTHSLGVRHCVLQRTVLPRSAGCCAVGQALGQDGLLLPAKFYRLEGRDYARPEADAVREAATSLGVGTPALRMFRPR